MPAPPRTKRRAVRRVRHHLEEMGVIDRMVRAIRLMKTKRFRQAFARARQCAPVPLVSLEDVRAVALGILEGFGAQLDGVVIKMTWDDKTKELGITCVPAIDQVEEGFRRAGLRPEDISLLPGDLEIG